MALLLDTTTLKPNIKKVLGCSFAKPPVDELRGTRLSQWKLEGLKETKKFDPRAVQAPNFWRYGFQSQME